MEFVLTCPVISWGTPGYRKILFMLRLSLCSWGSLLPCLLQSSRHPHPQHFRRRESHRGGHCQCGQDLRQYHGLSGSCWGRHTWSQKHQPRAGAPKETRPPSRLSPWLWWSRAASGRGKQCDWVLALFWLSF